MTEQKDDVDNWSWQHVADLLNVPLVYKVPDDASEAKWKLLNRPTQDQVEMQ